MNKELELLIEAKYQAEQKVIDYLNKLKNGDNEDCDCEEREDYDEYITDTLTSEYPFNRCCECGGITE